MQVSVLGTGIMGAAIARSLLRAGHGVTVWNRTPARAEPLAADGARVARSAAEAVQGADVVLSVVFDTDAVLDVLDEAGPVVAEAATSSGTRSGAGGTDAGPVWVQSTTVGVDGTREIVARAAALGVPLVEGMLVGTRGPAEAGRLTILLAGDADLAARARPALDAVSEKVVDVGGPVGRASALKLAVNSWVATLTAGTAQALSLAAAFDLDPRLFLDTIRGTASDSAYAQTKGAAMLAGTFEPQFAVDGLRKDLGLMIAAARETGTTETLLDALDRVFGVASLDGHGREDIAAVFDAFTRAPLGSGD